MSDMKERKENKMDISEQVKNIREVVAQLVSWASAEGLGYNFSAELLKKLYSGLEDDARQ